MAINGIRKSDPRLKGLMANLRHFLNKGKPGKETPGAVPYLDTDEFKQ